MNVDRKFVENTQGEVTSHIYGRSAIAILWGNTVVLCVVKW